MPWAVLGSVHRCLPGQAAGTECVHKGRREGDWTKRQNLEFPEQEGSRQSTSLRSAFQASA